MEEDIYTDIVEGGNEKAIMLEKLYSLVLNGIPFVSENIEELVSSYRCGNPDKEIQKFINTQIIKCTATGFMTGLGGAITMPITIPLDLASSIYIQLRMVAGIAALKGYDLRDDRVKTCVYLTLCGKSVSEIVGKTVNTILTKYTAKKLIPLISGKLLVKINRAVGFRLLAKGGKTAVIRITKMVPIVGGVVGGTYNNIETRFIVKYAKKMFEV